MKKGPRAAGAVLLQEALKQGSTKTDRQLPVRARPEFES